MKKIILISIIFAIVLGVIIYSNNSPQKNTESDYQAQKSSVNTNTTNTTNTNVANTNITNTNIDKPQNTQTQEKEIASFSTKIYNKEKARQNNISITCNTLTNTVIQSGETFSFCDVVGKATEEKGYQKADIFIDGEKKQGLGGGNCQVSTTLYNAILKIPELEVVERHEHSRHVPYIKDGKDAAVAYGSYDFKFKNNTDSPIKILFECDKNNVTAKIIQLINS